jgi:hypothetical protein
LKKVEYEYTIEHIKGLLNVWTDMLSRWGNHGNPSTNQSLIVNRIKTKVDKKKKLFIRLMDSDGFEWPSGEEIIKIQNENIHLTDTVVKFSIDMHGIRRINDKVWIPKNANELQLRLYIIAHCGPQGHRGNVVMKEHLSRMFHIENLDKKVDLFLKECLICKHVKGGDIIPHPWGPNFRSKKGMKDSIGISFI